MGFADRDYMREQPRRGDGGFSMLSVTAWLIILNVGVFILDKLLVPVLGSGQIIAPGIVINMTPLEFFGHFSAELGVFRGQIWRFVTFQFLHAGIGHLFFNMLALFFFGPLVERYLGRGRFIGFYLVCGIAGAATYLILWGTGWLVHSSIVPLVGASAGIFGILIGAAKIAPNTTIMLLFPPIPMQLKTFAWVMLAIAAVTILTGGHNAGGEAAHLGGAIVGMILMWTDQLRKTFAGPRY